METTTTKKHKRYTAKDELTGQQAYNFHSSGSAEPSNAAWDNILAAYQDYKMSMNMN